MDEYRSTISFGAVSKVLAESTAVDERRHDEVSARDLLEQVAAMCSVGTPVPSEQWLRL